MFINDFKFLFVPFRYAPLYKEEFKNSKPYLGFKIKCKFEIGLRSKKCKLFSGRDKVTVSCATGTMCIVHAGFSVYSSVVSRSYFNIGGQLITTQSLTAHTLERCAQAF